MTTRHTYEELAERISYSDKYSDSQFEYRHVILPKQMLKLLPKTYFQDDDSGILRILTEAEWRGIGITQSLGWETVRMMLIRFSTRSILRFTLRNHISCFSVASWTTRKNIHTASPQMLPLTGRLGHDFWVREGRVHRYCVCLGDIRAVDPRTQHYGYIFLHWFLDILVSILVSLGFCPCITLHHPISTDSNCDQ